MPTNEEIKKEYQDESKGIYHSFNTTRVIDDMLDKAKAEGYKEGKTDTAKQIFDKLDKVIPIDKCKCGHDKSDHDDESCDMSCMECRCIEYEDNDFISEYLKLKTIFEMKSKLGKKLKY